MVTKLSPPERALLLRVANAGGVLGMSTDFVTRSAEHAARALVRRGLLIADAGEYGLTSAGLGVAVNLRKESQQ